MRTNHHLLLVVLCMMLGISAKGQFFYPYNPYQNQQQMESAREYGANLYNKIRADLEKNARSNPTSCMAWIGSSIANDKLAKAEEWCGYLKKTKEKAAGYYFLGLVYELQGYPNLAKGQYREGMRLGHKFSAEYLNRLNTEGEMTRQQKEAVRMHYKQLQKMSIELANQMCNDDPLGSASRPSSSSRSYDIDRWKQKRKNCTACGGTGINPSAEPMSSTFYQVGYYHQDGTTRCPYCGKFGKHWHHRCSDCDIRNFR